MCRQDRALKWSGADRPVGRCMAAGKNVRRRSGGISDYRATRITLRRSRGRRRDGYVDRLSPRTCRDDRSVSRRSRFPKQRHQARREDREDRQATCSRPEYGRKLHGSQPPGRIRSFALCPSPWNSARQLHGGARAPVVRGQEPRHPSTSRTCWFLH